MSSWPRMPGRRRARKETMVVRLSAAGAPTLKSETAPLAGSAGAGVAPVAVARGPDPARRGAHGATLPPGAAAGEGELLQRPGAHLDRVAGRVRHDVAPATHPRRLDEVLVQLVDVLEHAVGQVGADRDVVHQRQ